MKEKFRFPNRLTRPVIVTLTAVAIVVAVYFFISSKGRIPGLPRIGLTDAEQKQVTDALIARIKGFEPHVVEKDLTRQLAGIHRLETMQNPQGAKLKEALAKFRETASNVIGEDRDRYLLLGDYLAFEFNRALHHFLPAVQRDGFSAVRANNPKMIEEIEIKGGSFLSHARSHGVIRDNGQLVVPQITPQVLFRIRWRHLGGLPIEEALTPVERKAYFGFVVAFTNPLSAKRRMGAIKRLKEMDNSYNDLIARAVVLHESGNDRKAYEELKNAIDQGRSEPEILNFAKALH